jgi:hypothetical protein
MKLSRLLNWAKDKTKFSTLDDYSTFSEQYLSFICDSLQAVIVSQNENHYRFFQYKKDGNFNITRPINRNLIISIDTFAKAKSDFLYAMQHIRDIGSETDIRKNLNNFIYTCHNRLFALRRSSGLAYVFARSVALRARSHAKTPAHFLWRETLTRFFIAP